MLLLDSSAGTVSLKLEPLGRINIPCAIAYLARHLRRHLGPFIAHFSACQTHARRVAYIT